MPKCEVTSDGLRKPPGVFSQATIIEASGRLLHFRDDGAFCRRHDTGIGDITAQTRQVREPEGRGRNRGRYDELSMSMSATLSNSRRSTKFAASISRPLYLPQPWSR